MNWLTRYLCPVLTILPLGMAGANLSTIPDGIEEVQIRLNKAVYETAGTPAGQQTLTKLNRLLTLKLAARGNQEAYELAQKRNPAATYLLSALGTGEVIHWSHMPLQVRIIPPAKFGRENIDYTAITMAALQTIQQDTANLIRFHVTKDPEQARLTIEWSAQQYMDPITTNMSVSGHSQIQTCGNTIINANISLSPYRKDGQLVTATLLPFVVMHEVFHALGIDGHSPTPSDLLFYCYTDLTAPHLTANDIATLKALYQMKPTITDRQELDNTALGQFAEALKAGYHLEFLNNNGLPSLETAARLNPQDATAQYMLGMAHYHHGNYLLAKSCLQKACQLLPTLPEAHAYLSIAVIEEALHLSHLTPGQREQTLKLSATEIDRALQLSDNARFIRQLASTQTDFTKQLTPPRK